MTEQPSSAGPLIGPLPERWGRMDQMSRTLLVEIGLILLEAGLITENRTTLEPDWTGGLIIGSRRGSLAVDLEFGRTVTAGPGMASPHLFGYTLANIAPAEAAIRYRLTGPVFSLIDENPFERARAEAEQWLAGLPAGRGLMIAGALDVLPGADTSEVSKNFTLLYA